MVEIIITMDEKGRFNIDLNEGLPLFTAIGALETAKNMLIMSDVEPTTNPMEEIITEEVQ